MANPAVVTELEDRSILGRVTDFFVLLFEKIMPDPYVFAVMLTFITAILAFLLAPHGSVASIASGWYGGLFDIMAFAFQIVLILVTGYVLANAPVIHSLLEKLACLPTTPRSAVSLMIVISMTAGWINWGFGLVAAALLAREIAKRIRMDFGWLVAAAYSGFLVSVEGLSGSIALSQATPGSALNMVQKVAGHSLPLSDTIFTRFNLLPVAALFIILPLVFRHTQPSAAHSIAVDPERLRAEDQRKPAKERSDTIGARLDRAWILNVALAGGGLLAVALRWWHGGVSLDLDSVILIFLCMGLLFHWTPAAYVEAMKSASRVTGPLILQYPLYGGIMGIMTATGLAGVISKAFLAFSTARTLPFWSYLASMVITLFIPSGGGHWAVQGPIVIPAAMSLHASLGGTTMAVAMGESVANMIQPFFALPVLAIAGIGMRRVMGFMVITFLIGLVTFGVSLLFLIPVA